MAFRGGITLRDGYVDARFKDILLKHTLASKEELIPSRQLAGMSQIYSSRQSARL